MKLSLILPAISTAVLISVSCSANKYQTSIDEPKMDIRWLPRSVLSSSVNWSNWDVGIYENTTVLVYEQSGVEDQKLAVKRYKKNDSGVVIYTDKDKTETDSAVRADIFVSPGSNQPYVVTILPGDKRVIITGEKKFKGQGNGHFVTTFTSSEAGILGIKARVDFYNLTDEYVKK